MTFIRAFYITYKNIHSFQTVKNIVKNTFTTSYKLNQKIYKQTDSRKMPSVQRHNSWNNMTPLPEVTSRNQSRVQSRCQSRSTNQQATKEVKQKEEEKPKEEQSRQENNSQTFMREVGNCNSYWSSRKILGIFRSLTKNFF